MIRASRLWVWVIASLVVISAAAMSRAGDDMVEHPWYKHWANCKPGSTVTLIEKTTFSGSEKDQVPDGIDERLVTRKLLSVSPDGVVVQTVIAERDFLGTIEAAPTKATYAAKIKKSHLNAALHHVSAKAGADTITFEGKKLMCQTRTGTEKKDGTTIEHKIWYSDAVPGGVVKRTQTTSQDGKVVAETSIMLKSFKQAE
jgi:hypothetical protein